MISSDVTLGVEPSQYLSLLDSGRPYILHFEVVRCESVASELSGLSSGQYGHGSSETQHFLSLCVDALQRISPCLDPVSLSYCRETKHLKIQWLKQQPYPTSYE